MTGKVGFWLFLAVCCFVLTGCSRYQAAKVATKVAVKGAVWSAKTTYKRWALGTGFLRREDRHGIQISG